MRSAWEGAVDTVRSGHDPLPAGGSAVVVVWVAYFPTHGSRQKAMPHAA